MQPRKSITAKLPTIETDLTEKEEKPPTKKNEWFMTKKPSSKVLGKIKEEEDENSSDFGSVDGDDDLGLGIGNKKVEPKA